MALTLKSNVLKNKDLFRRIRQAEKRISKLELCLKRKSDFTVCTVHPIRLVPDTEIKSFLLSFVQTQALRAAFILTCCGSVKKATLRYATNSEHVEQVETLDGCYEITSLVGTVCADGAHLHVTLGSSNGSTVAGHVVGDLIVQTTAEIVLADAVNHQFNRATDMATGWPELIVSK